MKNSNSLINPETGGFSRRSFFSTLASGVMALPLMSATIVGQRGSISNHPRMVPTLTGPVPAEKLGTMLIHEHVLWGPIPDDHRDESVAIAVGYLH